MSPVLYSMDPVSFGPFIPHTPLYPQYILTHSLKLQFLGKVESIHVSQKIWCLMTHVRSAVVTHRGSEGGETTTGIMDPRRAKKGDVGLIW